MPKDSSVNFKDFFPPTNSAFHQIGTVFKKSNSKVLNSVKCFSPRIY